MSDSTHKRAIFILAGAVFATMLGNGMVMPFIPVYVGQFGLGGLGAGLLFSAIADQLSLAWAFWAGGLINLGLIIACWLLLVGTPTELEGEPLRPVNTDPVEAE